MKDPNLPRYTLMLPVNSLDLASALLDDPQAFFGLLWELSLWAKTYPQKLRAVGGEVPSNDVECQVVRFLVDLTRIIEGAPE